jgi:hypothetical protein
MVNEEWLTMKLYIGNEFGPDTALQQSNYVFCLLTVIHTLTDNFKISHSEE